MKTLLLLSLLLAPWVANAQTAKPPQPLTSQLTLKWKAPIGLTSFKTNFVAQNGRIYVGSNGHHFRDYFIDNGSGVYVLDAKSGKTITQMAGEVLGDMDVNGVVLDGDRLYFGNDNEEFMCYTTSGKMVWRVPVSGDVEGVPVLMDVNGDKVNDLVYATETGEVAAIDSRNGKQIWSFKISDFNGWRKTNNRFVFKVNAWFYNGPGFVNKPAVADLNHDGTKDFIYSARDNYMYAIDGKSGRLLWRYEHNIYFNAITPTVQQQAGKTRIYFPVLLRESNGYWKTYLVSVNEQGHFVSKSETGMNLSVDAPPLVTDSKFISANTDTVISIDPNTGHLIKQRLGITHNKTYKDHYNSNNITMTPLLMDLLGLGYDQIVLISQGGSVFVLDPVSLVTLRQYELPEGTEANPLLADIDGDGKLELLVGSYDGNLYCYGLKTNKNKFASNK